MNHVSDSAISLTKWMTATEVRKMTARVMVSIDDLTRQRELVSRLSRTVVEGEESADLIEVLGMLNYQINEASESVREFKTIYNARRAELREHKRIMNDIMGTK